MDKEVLEKVRLTNRLSKKFVRTKDASVREEYNKVRNQVRKLTRKARREFEKGISAQSKSNLKMIWRYINSKSKTRAGIGDLFTDPSDNKSEVTSDDRDKANILSKFFSSVFTKEPKGVVPELIYNNIHIIYKENPSKDNWLLNHARARTRALARMRAVRCVKISV
jgi:hypothetical protein